MKVAVGGTVLVRATRLVAVAVGGILLAVMLTRGAGPGAPSMPAPAPPPPEAAIPEGEASPPSLPAPPARDIFHYVAPAPLPSSPSPTGMRAEPPAPSPEPVRLIGLVRRGGRLRAALAIAGEIDLAGAGEEAGGVFVLSVDEEEGVRIRLPDGRELVLPLPQ